MIARTLIDGLARRAMLALDPEDAHRLGLAALKLMPLPAAAPDDPILASTAFGLALPNPLGLAAGFDKNAEVPDAMLRLGFGFVEVGGVTPRPQPGNPRPRVFRLPRDEAVINRLGFNNDGLEVVRARLAARADRPGVVGVNLGSNKDTVDRARDYETLITALAPLASFLTLNVSSPNTPGLRDLQEARALDDLLARAVAARDRAAEAGRRRPLLLKIAPDLDLAALDAIVKVALARGLDGLVVSNTTVARPAGLHDGVAANQAGGLSGRPLFDASTRMLAETFLRVDGAVPLIGVGGIDSGAAAWHKLRAGASLVQLYTGMVYKGFGLIGDVKATIAGNLRRGGHARLADVVGLDALDWTGRAIEL